MFVGEVPIEGASGDIGLHTDLFDAGVFNTLLAKQPVGRLLDAAADFLFALFAAPQGHLCQIHEISVRRLQLPEH